MRILAVVLMLLGIASLSTSFEVASLYGRTRPRTPHEATGNVFPLNVHGTVVYLTRGEELLQFWSFAGGMLVAIAGGALFERYYPRHPRGA